MGHMSETIAVVTDSAASIPLPLRQRWRVYEVPLQVSIGDENRREGVDLTTDDVLDALERGQPASTSQPSPASFSEVYAEAAADGADAVVSAHISGKISGTVSGAQSAAESSPVPVTVVDTATMAMATGYAALAGAAKAAAGEGADAVAAEVARVAKSSVCVFTVESLEYLRRGGRVPGALAVIGDALGIRPVLTFEDGELVLAQKVRTSSRARGVVKDMLEEHIDRFRHPAISVMGLGSRSYADDMAHEVERAHPSLTMVVRTPVSAALAVHGGPGAFAAVAADMPSEFH